MDELSRPGLSDSLPLNLKLIAASSACAGLVRFGRPDAILAEEFDRALKFYAPMHAEKEPQLAEFPHYRGYALTREFS